MLDDLYTLIEQETDRFSIKLADRFHPLFQAHFPNNPILPGFIMIEIVSRVLDVEIKEIKKAKFQNPAYPLDLLQFYLNDSKVTIKNQNQNIAEFVYA